MNTSLAFLLVFRLNRVTIRNWETRTMWDLVTLNCRSTHKRHSSSLETCTCHKGSCRSVGRNLSYCRYALYQERPRHWGVLTRPEIERCSTVNMLHSMPPLRFEGHCMNRALRVTPSTLCSLTKARAVK